MRFIPAIALALVVAGCANDPAAAPAKVATAAPAPANQVCHKEMPTGSQIPVTVCEPVMSESERQLRNSEMANQIRRESPVHAVGGP